MKKILLLLLFVMVASVNAILYNTTNLTSSTDIYEQAKALNNITDNFIGYALILIAFVIPFIVTNNNTGSMFSGLGAGSFFAALTGAILLPLQFIGFDAYKFIVVGCGVCVLVSLMMHNN